MSRNDGVHLPERRIMTTSDEVFDACERSDRLLGQALGRTLEIATLRLGLILLAICGIAVVVIRLSSG
jgi:hypothetical protein